MPLVTWNDGYSVNIKSVDAQHQKLVSLLNELHDAMVVGKGKEVLGSVLNKIIDYTIYHFKTEEKYFDEYGYPESEVHKQQHREMVEKVGALRDKFEAGENVLTLDVMNFLRDWVHDHILGSDKLFGPYLNSKGVN